MNRGTFIKNIAGCIIGYALLPKQLKEVAEYGIAGPEDFQPKMIISIDTALINPHEILQTPTGMQIYVVSKEEGIIMLTGKKVEFKDFHEEVCKVYSHYGEIYTG